MACEICDNSPAMCRHRLEAIKARCEAADVGPWVAEDNRTYLPVVGAESYQAWAVRQAVEDARCSLHPSEANCEFIAHARADVPALVAALEDAQSEIRRLQGEILKDGGFSKEQIATLLAP